MKKSFAWLLAAMTAFALSACSASNIAQPTPTQSTAATQQPTQSAQPTSAELSMFSVVVKGVADVSEFNQDTYSNMDEQSVTLSVANAAGVKVDYVCRGVLLKDIVDQLGVSTYASVTVIGVDGYKKVFDKATIQDTGTLFAISVNGKTDDCPMMFAVSKGSGYSIKNVAQLIVQ
jgi:osmotically-inducible protein OsmY